MSAPLPRRVYKISQFGKAEDVELYKPDGLHPILIGDTFKDGRYRVVHKLGFGSFSTVWLARDTFANRYVSLKINRADFQPDSNELKILRYFAALGDENEASQYIIKLLDDFIIEGPNGNHQCIVTQVAGRRLARPAGVNYSNLSPARLLASQLFQAVRYMHTCNIGHGDLYTGNILLQLDSFDSWSDEEVYHCLGDPVQETIHRINGEPVDKCAPQYIVHPGDLSRLEARMLLSKVLIIDFGQAYFLDKAPKFTTSPSQFSPPENIFRQGISPASDIWALGCNTFEICAGYTLFKALFLPRQDVLRDMVAMLGKPPERFWSVWEERGRYFDDSGNPVKSSEHSISSATYPLLDRVRDIKFLYSSGGHSRGANLHQDEAALQTNELVQMNDFLSGVFNFDPDLRISTQDALSHPFLKLLHFSKI